MPVTCPVEEDTAEQWPTKGVHKRAVSAHHLRDFEDDLDAREFRDIAEIGSGNGGLVFKSVHLPSGRVTARKVRPASRDSIY